MQGTEANPRLEKQTQTEFNPRNFKAQRGNITKISK